MIWCPYDEKHELDWSSFTDEVKWTGDETGEIITTLKCKDPMCPGHKGFRVRKAFVLCDETTYEDMDGKEIEE